MKNKALVFGLLLTFLGGISSIAYGNEEKIKNVQKAPAKKCTPWDKDCNGIPDIFED